MGLIFVIKEQLQRAFCILYTLMCLIPVATRVKVWVGDCWLVGIAGSNPAWGTFRRRRTHVCLAPDLDPINKLN